MMLQARESWLHQSAQLYMQFVDWMHRNASPDALSVHVIVLTIVPDEGRPETVSVAVDSRSPLNGHWIPVSMLFKSAQRSVVCTKQSQAQGKTSIQLNTSSGLVQSTSRQSALAESE